VKTSVDILDPSKSASSKILRLAWPAVVSMLLHSSYSIVDMLWVSCLGTEAIAAVTVTGLILWGVFSISQIFASGVLALIARAYGANQQEKAARFLRDGLVSSFFCSALVAVAIAWRPDALLSRLGADAEVSAIGAKYVRIMALGSMGTIPLFTLTSGFRGTGDMITPLVLTSVSCVANILLDPILIFGVGPIPAFGLSGAAIASVVSILLSLAWGLSLTVRPRAALKINLTAPVDITAIKDLFAIGIPSGLHYILLHLTQTAMIIMMAKFGSVHIAATGISGRLTELSFLPSIGIGAATATIVGQYLGASLIDEARRAVRAAFRMTVLVTFLICLFYALRPQFLVQIFTRDPEVLMYGSLYLRLFTISIIFVSITIIFTRVFQGAGDTGWPTAVAAVRFLVFVGLGYFLGWTLDLEAPGIWIAMLGSAGVQTLLVAKLYAAGSWQHKTLESIHATEEEELPEMM
jgi:putative MATE family efflux protein